MPLMKIHSKIDCNFIGSNFEVTFKKSMHKNGSVSLKIKSTKTHPSTDFRIIFINIGVLQKCILVAVLTKSFLATKENMVTPFDFFSNI